MVEQGSHAELLQKPEGAYAALYTLQAAAPTKQVPSFEEMQAEKAAIVDAAAGGLIPAQSLEKQVGPCSSKQCHYNSPSACPGRLASRRSALRRCSL